MLSERIYKFMVKGQPIAATLPTSMSDSPSNQGSSTATEFAEKATACKHPGYFKRARGRACISRPRRGVLGTEQEEGRAGPASWPHLQTWSGGALFSGAASTHPYNSCQWPHRTDSTKVFWVNTRKKGERKKERRRRPIKEGREWLQERGEQWGNGGGGTKFYPTRKGLSWLYDTCIQEFNNILVNM